MEVIGFHAEEVVALFQLIACVLKLGNLQFQHHNNIDGTDGSRIANDDGASPHLQSEGRGVTNKLLFWVPCLIVRSPFMAWRLWEGGHFVVQTKICPRPPSEWLQKPFGPHTVYTYGRWAGCPPPPLKSSKPKAIWTRNREFMVGKQETRGSLVTWSKSSPALNDARCYCVVIG